jgi:hypothetical protein
MALAGQLQQLPVAVGDSRHGQDGLGLAGGWGQDCGGVGVLVGVDADGRPRRTLPAWPCVVLLARRMTWSVPVRDEARQDCDGTRPLASGGQAPPSGQQLRPGRRRQPRVDKSSARHPSGSVILRVTPTATSSSPGSSPNRWAVSQPFSRTFHQAYLQPTRPFTRNAAQPELPRPNWTVETRRLAVIS